MDSDDIVRIILTIVIILYLIAGIYSVIDDSKKTQYKVIGFDNNEYIVNGSDLCKKSMFIDLDNKRILIKSWEEIK